MPPPASLTATTFAPISCSSLAAVAPTLPKPCTATVAPLRFTSWWRAISWMTYCSPRPVASERPSVPPTATGLPVTTPAWV